MQQTTLSTSRQNFGKAHIVEGKALWKKDSLGTEDELDYVFTNQELMLHVSRTTLC